MLDEHDLMVAEYGLRLAAIDGRNTNSPLLWNTPDFRRLTREAISGRRDLIFSQPFYTSANGYKMCARLYPKGDGAGKGTNL